MTSCKIMPPYSLSFTSFLAILLSLVSTIDAKKGGFLFFCFGDDCEEWQTALTVLSIVFTVSGLVMWICCKCRGVKREEKVNRRYEDAEEASRG